MFGSKNSNDLQKLTRAVDRLTEAVLKLADQNDEPDDDDDPLEDGEDGPVKAMGSKMGRVTGGRLHK